MHDAIVWHSAIAHDFDTRYALRPAFRERLALWTDCIARYATPAARVLDAGCGSGVLAFVAAGHARHVSGVDASPAMIAMCEDKKRRNGAHNITFRLSRIEELQASRLEPFDLVLCSSVLEYTSDYWATLAQLRTLAKPGATLLFSLPNGQSLYRWGERASYAACRRPAYLAHVRHFPSRRRLVQGLNERGYSVLETRTYAATPLLSAIARPLGAAFLADNLLLVAARA